MANVAGRRLWIFIVSSEAITTIGTLRQLSRARLREG
jgi:hypothetical protein